MHHHHDHGPARGGNRKRMAIALAINTVLLAVGVVGALAFGSIALLADAGHVLSDIGAIALGLLAAALAARPARGRRTFGYQRTEILAALANGLALCVIAVLVAVEAAGRLSDPPAIEGLGVVIVGVIGLAGNGVATLVLAGGDRQDLNLEGVLRHSAADALGSVGVIVSAILILAAGLDAADPVASLLISALVLASSWRLISEPLDVLMEAAPHRLDVERLGREICAVDEVRGVHDLHVWTVTAGFETLAAHVVVDRGADRDLVRARVEMLLRDRFGIDHTTLQVEEEADEGLIQLD